MKIAILGGGQLARMLLLEAHRLGIECHVFCTSRKDPAALVTPNVSLINTTAPYFNKKCLTALENCTHLTFESEFFLAKNLNNELNKLAHLFIFPNLKCLGLLQNRVSQKTLLNQFKIPTAPWFIINSEKQAEFAFHKLGAFVLKKSFGGYDGNGTFIIKSEAQLKSYPKNFWRESFIAESFISFNRELAITFVRGIKNDIRMLPLVHSSQLNNRCNWVMGPTRHNNLNSIVIKIKKLLSDLDYIGAISFELFDTGEDLLVNEIAPRVHNSAHYSQNALELSQFGFHLLSVMDSHLPRPKLICKQFLMLNLIGVKSKCDLEAPRVTEGILHWYGKREERVGRKLGHINFTTQKQDPSLLKRGLEIRKKIGY